MVPRKPKLVFMTSVRRSPFMRRFAWSLLAAVAALGAVVALVVVEEKAVVSDTLRIAGLVFALGVTAYFVLRGLLSFWRGIRRRNEDVRFFDRGFIWTRGGKEYKYAWTELDTFYERGGGIFIGDRPVWQRGAYIMKMIDGQEFRFTPKHGNMKLFIKTVRRYVASVTGTRMGRALRQNESVQIHKNLTLFPGGVAAGKVEIPWALLDVKLKGGKLRILRREKAGAEFKKVKNYGAGDVGNLSGFLELVGATIRNNQPDRFGKKRRSP